MRQDGVILRVPQRLGLLSDLPPLALAACFVATTPVAGESRPLQRTAGNAQLPIDSAKFLTELWANGVPLLRPRGSSPLWMRWLSRPRWCAAVLPSIHQQAGKIKSGELADLSRPVAAP